MQTESLFFNDTATTEIYTLSLHDALPISPRRRRGHRDRRREARRAGAARPARPRQRQARAPARGRPAGGARRRPPVRSGEYTSEIQSRQKSVCRLLLVKKQYISSL